MIFTPPSIRAISSTRSSLSSTATRGEHLAVRRALGDLPLLVGRGRDLRQVGDAHHLVPAAQLLQHPADDLRDAPADAGVHFVEYERRHLRDLASPTVWIASERRDSSPPEATFASGCGSMPLCAETRNSTLSSPQAVTSVAAGSATSKRPPAIARSCMAAVTWSASFFAAFFRPPRAFSLPRRTRRSACSSSARRASEVAARAQLVQPGLRGGKLLRQLLGLHAILARRAVHRVEPLFDLAQPLRIEIDPLGVAPQAVRGFLQLDARRLERVEDVLQPRIEFEQTAVSRLTTAFTCARLACSPSDRTSTPNCAASIRLAACASRACCVGQLLPFARRRA